MTVSVVFAIAGVIALLFGIIGGGVRAKELEVPPLAGKVRIFTGVIGLILIGMAIFFEIQSRMLNRADVQPIPTAVQTARPENLPAATILPNLPAAADTAAAVASPDPIQVRREKSIAELSKAGSWNLILKDTFDDNASNWTLYNGEYDTAIETMQVSDGVLSWGLQLKEPDLYIRDDPSLYSYSDFYLSVRAQRMAGTSTDVQAFWGLVFREKGDKHYAFEINDTQEYAVRRTDGTNWTELVGWTRSALIEPNRFNELTVIADGSDLYFFINGTPVELINDSTYSDGNVAIMVGLENVINGPTNFAFDDFELREKP